MECNKDEAARAKEIAEKKFLAKDISGAKKFALKAQNLFPELEGITHMLAMLNVYVCAENKINGEADWYGILGVSPRDDEDAIRKQFRKLALMLHPDKNKVKGADGAFNLISQAWNLLSDKAQRSAYDKKRNVKGFRQTVQPTSGASSTSAAQNGFHNFTKGSSSSTKIPKNNSSTVPTNSHKQKPPTAPASCHKDKSATVPPSHKQKTSTTPTSSYKQKPDNVPVTSHKRKRVPTVPRPSQSQEPEKSTFWTACNRCKMQYEYPRMYVNRNLLCPNCREPFFSFEIAGPPAKGEHSVHQRASKSNRSSRTNSSPNPNVKSGVFRDSNSSNFANFQWTPFSKTAGAASAAQAASMVHHAYEKVKREREEAQAATKREESLRKKNQASDKASDVSSFAENRNGEMEDPGAAVNIKSMENGTGRLSGLRKLNFKQLRVSKTISPCSITDFSNFRIQHLLTEKARIIIQKKLNEWNLAAMDKSALKGNEHEKTKEAEKDGDSIVNGVTRDDNISSKPLDARKANLTIKSTRSYLGGKFDRMPTTIEVPDSEFHDFDKDRNEKCFGENQVWAAYDNDDGMPRYYAMIHRVLCTNPFKIQISWLDSRTLPGSLNWNRSALSKTCGNFRIGKQETSSSIGCFSHKVQWKKGSVGAVQIYPRSSDIWSLYRNWSPGWDELTAAEVVHKYDIVEVLEDYDEEKGVTVIPLVKVAGLKAVFHRHLDPSEVRRIPREEIFRFSHYIPSYLVTGQEAPNAPKGCWELDPAALPFDLLHVIPDVRDKEIMESEEKYEKESILDNVEKSNNNVMEYDK